MRTKTGILSVTAASIVALAGATVTQAEPMDAVQGAPAPQDNAVQEAPAIEAPEAQDPAAQDADTLDPEVQVDLEANLAEATINHLQQQGHYYDESAQAIASEWAQQAATGQVEFQAGVGQGVNHQEEGTGNIYRLTQQEAQDRYEWLQAREANPFDDGHAFGVGSASDGTYFYVAEYFLY